MWEHLVLGDVALNDRVRRYGIEEFRILVSADGRDDGAVDLGEAIEQDPKDGEVVEHRSEREIDRSPGREAPAPGWGRVPGAG